MSAHEKDTRTRVPRTIRALAVPLILVWVAFTAAVNLLVPQVEKVGMANAVSMSPQDAPSVIAAKRMGQKKFGESTSDSIAMVVLVGDQPLGEAAHRYYETLVGKFNADTKHVEHVHDFWGGDMITAAGVQSSDGKAAYVQLNLAGDQGSTEGNHSVDAVRKIIADTPPPPAGLHAYVTGPAPLTTDSLEASDRGMIKMTVVTMIVITIMLALVYRSFSTVLLIFGDRGDRDGFCPWRGRGDRPLGHHGLLDVLGSADDSVVDRRGYRLRDLPDRPLPRGQAKKWRGPGIGLLHRFSRGGWACHSGLRPDHRGRMLTLRLTRLSYFNSLAYPSALALIIVVAAALTVAPCHSGRGQPLWTAGPPSG